MTITDLSAIQGLDLYILDQILKGRLTKSQSILDAGCGSGRNFIVLEKLGFDITAFDSNDEVISILRNCDPNYNERVIKSSIEDFPSNKRYDYIIANAVLHFASSHKHFEALFDKLVSLIAPNGQIFIRMTSNLAIDAPFETNEDGIAYLPDESFRYLLEPDLLERLMDKHNLNWIEPIKTVNVSNLRCMSTIILQRS